MTYEESAALMTNPQFRGRIKVACLQYAYRILQGGGPTPNAVLRWAQSTFSNPDSAAQLVQPPTVMEPAVQTQGASIDDSTLQFSVEQALTKMI